MCEYVVGQSSDNAVSYLTYSMYSIDRPILLHIHCTVAPPYILHRSVFCVLMFHALYIYGLFFLYCYFVLF
jgi:hypothetical protein